ncbi:MAG: hypothetical protein Q9170_000114 [Blastenia crenularia]
MPTSTPSNQLGKAVLDSVQNGTYPDSEDIISAELSPSALFQALELFEHARDDVKNCIRTSSKETAQDIDGWILQAKQLREDIETTQRSSHEILVKAERNEELWQSVHDAGSKLRLLEEEVAFNESLAATLERARRIRHQISEAQILLDRDALPEAVELLLKTETELASVESGRNVKAIALLQLESNELRQDVANTLTREWYDVVQVDDLTSTVSLPLGVKSLSEKGIAMQQVGLLGGFIADLANKLESTVIERRLTGASTMERLLIVEDNRMTLSQASSPGTIHQLFSDLSVFMEFLQKYLPPVVLNPLSNTLGPSLVSKVISMRLALAVPEELAALQDFSSTREEVYQFAETMKSRGWPGTEHLLAWTKSIPEAWLEKRQKNSLDKVRKLLKRGFGDISTVERVETQVVSQQDHLFAGNASNDDWNVGWSDEEDRSPVEKKSKPPTKGGDEEEDGSAWGLDDIADEESNSKDTGLPVDENVDHDAWGWGDDNETDGGRKAEQRKRTSSPKTVINGRQNPDQKSEREVTLKESYNITSLPIGVADLIYSILADRDAIREQR